MKEIVGEIVRREAGNEFQLYGTDNLKAREQVEWVLLKLGVSRRNMFDDIVIVLLIVSGREMSGTM